MHHPEAVLLAIDFMHDCRGSYSKLADHLNLFKPRPDGPWTKHSVYHLCRTNGITSVRPCRAQPAAANTQRTHTRQRITTALLEALSASGTTIADIVPVSLKDVAALSGQPLYNIRNNWRELEQELNKLGGL